MERIICDIYRKDAPPRWGDDPNTPLNQKITAVNNMFGWLYDTGLLRQVSFEFKETPDAVCFAFDAKDLLPHRSEMEASGIDGAALAVHNIFDEDYSPCAYSGVIQVSWPMSTYRDVDGCVGRSWECTLIQGLNTEAIYAVNDIREGEGVKAAVKSLFSHYIWPEPEVERSVVIIERDYKGAFERYALTPEEFKKEFSEYLAEMDTPSETPASFTLQPLVHLWYCTTTVGSDMWSQFFTDMSWGLSDSDIASGNLAYIRDDFMFSLKDSLPQREPSVSESLLHERDTSAPIPDEKISAALQCLIDNGIEEDEAETVLQALGYILLDSELFPEERRGIAYATEHTVPKPSLSDQIDSAAERAANQHNASDTKEKAFSPDR